MFGALAVRLSLAGKALEGSKQLSVRGSGPAGLAAAHDLALLGFAVTLYEMEPILGGMLAVGIPHYRLPRALIQAEIETIVELGVKAVTNCCVGRDVTLPDVHCPTGAPREAIVKISRAEPGGIGQAKLWRPAALGIRPSYENKPMQQYLAGRYVKVDQQTTES